MSHLHYCPDCHGRWDHLDYECFGANDLECPACDRVLTEYDHGGAERQADGDPCKEEV